VRTPLVAIPLIAALIGLTGCGGDGEPTSTTTGATTAAAGDAATGAASGPTGGGTSAPAAVPDVEACSLLRPAEVGKTLGVGGVTSRQRGGGRLVECMWAPAELFPNATVSVVGTGFEGSYYKVHGIEPEAGFLGADRGGADESNPRSIVIVASKGDTAFMLQVGGAAFGDDALRDQRPAQARALAKLVLDRL
jgi:hypothetical protein